MIAVPDCHLSGFYYIHIIATLPLLKKSLAGLQADNISRLAKESKKIFRHLDLQSSGLGGAVAVRGAADERSRASYSIQSREAHPAGPSRSPDVRGADKGQMGASRLCSSS